MASPHHLLTKPQSRIFHVTRVVFNIYNCCRGTLALYVFCHLVYKTVSETSFVAMDTSQSSNNASYRQLLSALPTFVIEVVLFITGFIGAMEYDVNSLRFYSIILTLSSIVYVAWTITSTLLQAHSSTGETKVSFDIVLFAICLTSELLPILLSCVLIHYISLIREPQSTACDTICGSLFAILWYQKLRGTNTHTLSFQQIRLIIQRLRGKIKPRHLLPRLVGVKKIENTPVYRKFKYVSSTQIVINFVTVFFLRAARWQMVSTHSFIEIWKKYPGRELQVIFLAFPGFPFYTLALDIYFKVFLRSQSCDCINPVTLLIHSRWRVNWLIDFFTCIFLAFFSLIFYHMLLSCVTFFPASLSPSSQPVDLWINFCYLPLMSSTLQQLKPKHRKNKI